MKLRITGPSAASLVKLGVTARVIYGVVIDMPDLYNAGWLAILMGGLLTLPMAMAAGMVRKRLDCSPAEALRQSAPHALHPLAGALALLSAQDAAVVASGIAFSASYAALNSVAVAYLLIPQFLLALWCLRLNGDAIGSSAGLWNKVLPWLLLIVVLLEARDYRPAWLTPVLGPGVPKLLDGAVRVAGWLSLPIGLTLIAEPGERGDVRPWNPMKTLALSVGLSTFVCLMNSMMTPARLDSVASTRFYQLDALLSNGRTSLSLQLPTIALWFISLFYALLFDAFSCAALLETAIPRLNRRASVWITLIAVSLLTMSRFAEQRFILEAAWALYAASGVVLGAVMLLLLRENRRDVKQNA